MNPVSYLKNLKLPTNQYLVVGSAILSIKNIKPLNDIDLLVSSKLFQELKEKGWRFQEINKEGVVIPRLSYELCEAFTDFREKNFDDWTRDQSIIEIIDGISFLNIKEVLRIKRQWLREKDIIDIKKIEEYLQQQDKK